MLKLLYISFLFICTFGYAGNLTPSAEPYALQFSDFPSQIQQAGQVFGQPLTVEVIDSYGNLIAEDNGRVVSLECARPLDCGFYGTLYKATVNGRADFSNAALRLFYPTDAPIDLIATSPGLVVALPPYPLQLAPGDISLVESSIAASAPTSINVSDGVVMVVLLDSFRNPVPNQAVTLNLSASNGRCFSACSESRRNGAASCLFSCDQSGAIVEIEASTVSGAIGKAVVQIP